ncbi:MAG: LPXTG cell wall anchor domain-containing protein [Acidimicrobiia bacterium]
MRFLVRIGLVAGLLSLLGAPALAQEYPPTGSLTVSDSTVTPGQTITASGTGCAPGASVTFTLDPGGTTLATTTADSSGGFSAQVTIPVGTAPGTYTLAAACPPVVLNTTITVQAPAQAAEAGALPTTGSDSTTPAVWIALALLAFGTTMVVGARRRATVRHSQAR